MSLIQRYNGSVKLTRASIGILLIKSFSVKRPFSSQSSKDPPSKVTSKPPIHPNPPPLPLTYLRTPSGRLQNFRLSPINLPNSPEFGQNQNITVDEETKARLKAIIDEFNAPIKYAFAYGSGVFQQSGYHSKSRPMVDFIFGVTHPEHWHALNLLQHRNHYSFLGSLGSYTVSRVQENIGAGIYFNPFVEVNGISVKYGVVSIDRLCQDLLDWDTLYLAGRMHKPVKILRDDARVRLANQVNLTSALRTALLTLPPKFSERDLYTRISSISYRGDFRMTVGENPNKIVNIVSSQMGNFRKLYEPLIDDFPYCGFADDANIEGKDGRMLEQETDQGYRGILVQKLPKGLYNRVKGAYLNSTMKIFDPEKGDIGALNREIAGWDGLQKSIEVGLSDIIRNPALTQSLKGLLTAGPVRSMRYVTAKLGKWWGAKK